MKSLTEIQTNQEFGRYLVAAENLTASQVFIEETPFAYGPKPENNCVCLECFVVLDGKSGSRCQICSWPLCEECRSQKCYTHRSECNLFRETEVKFQNLNNSTDMCLQLDCILPLR